ncbi:hypothetical protein [Halomicrobium urmianum]|uniref:hypothetical protein n=1 Tax=Halomicrobium urmianum TaxID=1586233 RepID=UPI001CDA44EB|nr:hypothetical protein [Halomicrobium urmianum]
MISREVVDEIGVSYADADPIFFPYVDGELYSLPLPDGRYLTATGIVDDLNTTDEDVDEDEVHSEEDTDGEMDDGESVSDEPIEQESDEYTVDAMLLAAAQTRDAPLSELVSEGVSSVLKDAIENDLSVSTDDVDGPRRALDAEISDRHERLLDAIVDDSDEIESVDPLLDLALQRELTGGISDRTVELDGVLADVVQSISDDVSLDEYVADAVRAKITEELDL